MAADFMTRIILDDSKFNDTISKVRKQLDVTGSVTSGISSALKGMAGQIAAAAGVYEMFDTAVNSNAMSQERWNETLGTAKESVDSFFTSLYSGDWSVFEDGVLNAIKLSRDYVKALRNMKLASQIGDVRLSQHEKDLNLYENQATDKNLSKAEREGAFSMFQDKAKETVNYISNLSSYVNDQMNNMLEGKGIKPNDNVRKMIFKYLDPSTDGSRLLKEYQSLYEQITNLDYSINHIDVRNATGAKMLEQMKARRAALSSQLQAHDSRNPELAEALKLKRNFGTEEELNSLLEITDKIIGYEDRIESVRRQVAGLQKDFGVSGNLLPVGGGSGKEFLSGSLADLDKQISDLKGQINLSVDPESRISLYAELKEIEGKKHIIEFQYKHPNAPGLVPQDANLASLASLPKSLTKIDPPIKKKDVKVNNDFAESLMAISNIMGSVTSMTSEGAAAWVAWGGNLLASIAAAIPAITTLIGLKSTEAVVNGVASATQTPLVGWLLAGAAAASVIGAIMAIPAFATGGIVPGSSTAGDKVLARVNSGEMVLNTQQQGNLFSLLNGGGAAGSGQVDFKIRGKDLVGVLNNYNNQRNKIL